MTENIVILERLGHFKQHFKLHLTANEKTKFKVGSFFVLVEIYGGNISNNRSEPERLAVAQIPLLTQLITASLGIMAPLCAHSLCGASLFQQT